MYVRVKLKTDNFSKEILIYNIVYIPGFLNDF